MSSPARPRRKPKVSKSLFPGRDKKRYETWKRYRPGAGEQREGYHRARRAIKRAEQKGERPSSWDEKIVSEYKPETAKQRQGKIDRFGDFLQEAAIQAGLLAFPYGKVFQVGKKVLGSKTGRAALTSTLTGLPSTSLEERKRGGRARKNTGKKRRRVALRGHRSELRGG